MILSPVHRLFLLLSLLTVLTVKANTRRHLWTALINDQRIVGGQEIEDEPVPFMAFVTKNAIQHCGGAIINARTVLSAAHCYEGESAVYEFHVGDNTQTLKHGKILKAELIFMHPKYETKTADNDVAIVRLNETLIFNERVQPIALIESNANLKDGSIATVYGWGLTSNNGPGSEVLKFAEVPLMNHKLCKRLMSEYKITKNMLCAGDIAGGIDACGGDSGGPMVQNDRVIGLVSFGHECALRDRAGVYTDVRRMLPWVKETLYREFGEKL